MTEEEFDARRTAAFRQSHHMIATMFAMGFTPQMISRQTGRSIRSLHLLRDSPMFVELETQKRKALERREEQWLEEVTEEAISYDRMMRRNKLLAEQMITDRLEVANETGDFLSLRELNMITADRADRLGFSKRTEVRHSVGFDARLEKAIVNSAKVRALPPVIEGNVVEIRASTPIQRRRFA